MTISSTETRTYSSLTIQDLLFARHIVKFVIRNGNDFGRDESSPFTPLVSEAVKWLLDNCKPVMMTFYRTKFPSDSITTQELQNLCIRTVLNLSEKIYRPEQFLAFCTTFAVYAAMSYSQGITDSPNIIVKAIVTLLLLYKRNGVYTEYFWTDMEKRCEEVSQWLS